MKKGKKKYPKKIITHTTKREYFTPKREYVGHDVKVMDIGPKDDEFKKHCYNMICEKVILKYEKNFGIDDVVVEEELSE